MKNIRPFEEFESSNFQIEESSKIQEGNNGREMKNYMFFQNLHTLKNAIEELLELDSNEVDEILSDGHGWALDHIATSVDDVEEVYHFLSNTIEMGDHEMSHEQDDEVNIEGSDDKVEIEAGEEDE